MLMFAIRGLEATAAAVLVGGMRIHEPSMHEVIARARAAGCRVVVGGAAPTTSPAEFADADLVFIGMRPPDDDETVDSYAEYYRGLIERTEGFPMLAIVLAAEKIKFQDIFI